MEQQPYNVSQAPYKRPRAWEKVYQWHIGQVPDSDPSKKSAIFVVHGMGKQNWAETSALLRNNMEVALEVMLLKNNKWENLPAPFVQEGYWADYDNLKKSFEDEWARLEDTKRPFFQKLWNARSISMLRTFGWFVGQSLRLILDMRILFKTPLAILYIFYCSLLLPPSFY